MLVIGVQSARADVFLTSLEGTSGAAANEGYASLVDGKISSKWCVTGFTGAYIIFKASEPVLPSTYYLVTGGDTEIHPDRNWKKWKIYGANFNSDAEAKRDAEGWTLVDNKEGVGQDQLPGMNTWIVPFVVSETNTTEFTYFKIEVEEVYNIPAENRMQMAEFSFDDPSTYNYTALSGVAGFNDAEGYASLVDGSSNTKWCSNKGDWFIVFKASQPMAPAYYSLSTANDTGGNPGRNWKAWDIYAANFATDDLAKRESDGWVLLDSRTDVGTDRLPAASYTDAYFGLTNTESYQYFKIEVRANVSGDIQQMAEFTFGLSGSLPRVRENYYKEVASFNLDITADKALLQQYSDILVQMQNASDVEAVIELNAILKGLQTDINASRNAYTTYLKAVDFMRTYMTDHPEMSGQGRKLFDDYLNKRIEPNATYPNGSNPYIMEMMNLTNEQLGQETDYIYDLLDQYTTPGGDAIESVLVSFAGTDGVKDTENYPGFTDGDQATKWCVKPYERGNCYVIMHSMTQDGLEEVRIKPTFYALTTANDTQSNPGRNWKNWRIFAGNFESEEAATRDAAGWTLIDEKLNIGTNELPAANFTKVFFYLSEVLSDTYAYFKVEVDENVSGDVMQMADFEFGNQANFMNLRNMYYDECAAFDVSEIVAQKVLIDEYEQKLAELKKTNTMNNIAPLYNRLVELQGLITSSADNYANYIATIEEIKDNVVSAALQGPAYDFLKAYLEENIAPGDVYPNGSYPYIIENCLLDNRTVQFEITYANNLLEAAINSAAVALSGTSGYNGSEGFSSLIDGNTESKWAGTYEGTAFVVFKTGKAVQPFFYTLVTANDAATHPNRNWKDWAIYGGKFESDEAATQDAEGWVLLDRKTGIGQDRLLHLNFTECYFGFSEELTEEYQYFKVEVTASFDDGNAQQMSELIWGSQVEFNEIVQKLQDEAQVFIEGKEVVESRLLEMYEEKVQAMIDGEDMETVMSFWLEVKSLQSRIDNSLAAYTAYTQMAEYLKDFLTENDGIVGDERDKLEEYLVDYEEPGELFPNGTYEYIIETLSLNADELNSEIALMKQMLENALRAAPTVGTDVSLLLKNPDFSDGFNGWEGEATGTDKIDAGIYGAISDGMTFDLHQTVSGLKNGYYLVSLNGVYRPNGKGQDTNYGAYLYAGDQMNYIQAAVEDIVTEENAIDKENCSIEDDLLLENDFGEVLGYTPKNAKGMAYAIMAGRYINEVLVKVTDGTLTLGLCDKGTTLGADWTAFGNFHLIYIGELSDETAQHYAREGVISQAERAQTLLDYVGDVADFKRFPNFSEELRNRLRVAISQTEGDFETDPEKPYQLTQTFTDLFQEIYECKRAYVALMNTTEIFYARVNQDDSEFTDEQKNEVNTLVFNIWDKWESGLYSTEEAWAQTDIVDNPYYLQLYGRRPEMVNGVYQIKDAQEVRWMATAVNDGDNTLSAVLTRDIDLTPEMDVLQPIGTSSVPFKGKFDGQNHKITGLKIEAKAGMAGFFGKVQNADIRNFSIEGSIVCAGPSNGTIAFADASTISNVHSALSISIPNAGVTHTAGIAGECQNGCLVSFCTFSGTMTVDGNNNDCFGGICGYTNTSRFENCANMGTIYFSRLNCYAGGILGYINNTACQGPHNCLNVGKLIYTGTGTPTNSGAIIGWLRGFNASIIGTSYWLEGTAEVGCGVNSLPTVYSATAQQMASGEVCFALNTGQGTVWYQTLGEDPYPVLDSTHRTVYRTGAGTYSNEEGEATHAGTEDDPFEIRTAEDLANLRNLLVSGRMNYIVMTADVDMSGYSDFKPLFDIPDQSAGYPFIDFDGKNHVIRNLSSNNPEQWYNGLFGVLCGNVRNLGVENANIVCEASGTGIISGYLGHASYGKPCYVENVWVTGKVRVTQGYCGGMFGNIADESHILNCYANVEITGAHDYTGGIIGRVRGLVDMVQCYAAGSINRGGGIIGGGFTDATPLGTYKHVVVWNNTDKNFGPARDGEDLRRIEYYDGTNFSQLQQEVVSWDPEVWYSDMAEGSYPVLANFTSIGQVAASQRSIPQSVYDLQGLRITGKPTRGLYIIDGKRVLVK